jgi:hypothetical protein
MTPKGIYPAETSHKPAINDSQPKEPKATPSVAFRHKYDASRQRQNQPEPGKNKRNIASRHTRVASTHLQFV